MKLGKLHEVDIRKVWPHEQYDFSKWLAAEENIQELGNVLNLSLTDIETERPVDRYRCDILCRDEITGKVVLIENQLEQTNHDHLGKILTYASGLDASVVVWVVAAARDEHASAIEWLNKHTDDSISFFLIEIHAYKIGDSEPAPQFKIIEQARMRIISVIIQIRTASFRIESGTNGKSFDKSRFSCPVFSGNKRNAFPELKLIHM